MGEQYTRVANDIRASLNKPAVAVDATTMDVDSGALARTADRAQQHDSHVLVAADPADADLMSQLRPLGVTVVEIPESKPRDPVQELCTAAIEIGFPGIIIHPLPKVELQYEDSYDAFQRSDTDAITGRVADARTDVEVIAGIPVVNEPVRLESLVAHTQDYVDDVLVVADGSSEAPLAGVRKAGATIVERNADGTGAAIKTLFKHVAQHFTEFTALVVLDAEREREPAPIPELIEPVSSDDADVVLGRPSSAGDRADESAFGGLWQRLQETLSLGDARQRAADADQSVLTLSPAAVSHLEGGAYGESGDTVLSAILNRSIRADLNVRIADIVSETGEELDTHKQPSAASAASAQPTQTQRPTAEHQSVIVGANTQIHDAATVGHEYTVNAEPTVIGDEGTVRAGTIIYQDVVIGDEFATGHNALVREQTTIGHDVLVGTDAVVDGYTDIGSHVSIQTAVYIPSYTELGDEVFIGPGAVLTNDPYPIREDVDLTGPTLRDGCSIGANATIIPDVTVGENAFVAAGTVVTDDVPPDTLAVGVPAEHRPLPKPLRGGNEIA